MTPTTLPTSQRAVQQDGNGKLHVANNAAIPSLLPGHVLVKTYAVALNPSDYKIQKNFPIPGAYVGIDFSGTVVQVANDVDSINPGTEVFGAAFTFSSAHRLANGAFAEYVRVRADLLFRIPSEQQCQNDGDLTLFKAATLGTAMSTCLLSLWSPDALGLVGKPEEPVLSEKPIPVLVYGGSTSVGTIAIQLLKLSGYDPIATCSPRSFDLVRSRGASNVFDYSSADVALKIKTHTGGRLKYALDCISDVASVATCYAAIQRPGGRYVSLEYIPDELLAQRRAVRPNFVLSAELYGEEIVLGEEAYDRPANREKHQLAVQNVGMLQRLIDSGGLKTHPTEEIEGGLEGVVKGLVALAGGGHPRKLVAVV
uniref:Trans-enoyl reductase TwmE n=1 Tax=Talaromyces wortmannii TaxID=28567 RepID=TWME_TALWO|nr:RecName: Full=Trans-enoyl reductase TwmE; AltName: Full=Wortmanamides biosynthesis cluster protein E [Talaromyces wortmannii]AUY61973.1 TwnE [Talaromyces wortmannii]QBC19713.1 TwmE [Talaromyces wortmannii]